MIKKLNEKEFEQEVLNEEDIVLVDFYADWCGPCKMTSPQLESAAKETSNKIFKVNVDEQGMLAAKYDVMTIPTLIVFENGIVSNRSVGFKTKNQILDLFK